jgi:predicted nucleic acid-binding protein
VIILDTNILSEPLRARPEPVVLRWLAEIAEDTVLTSVTVGEILTGVRRLPPGRRREGLLAAIETTLTTFADQVLPYDEPAARCYAQLQELRRAAGHALSVEDGMIAAICRVRGAILATRNTKDFDGLGVELINPWTFTN